MGQIKRGEIYYVEKFPSFGSETRSGRPGIIVSNDRCNGSSDVVEVVFLTTQPKADLPTHVRICSSGTYSIALCEQINSVNKSRLTSYYGTCSSSEIEMLDCALMISLGLSSASSPTSASADDSLYKQLYENLLDKVCSLNK